MALTIGASDCPSSKVADEEAFLFAMQLICMADVPQALNATLQLGLLEVIAEGGRPMSATDIVAYIPAKNPKAAAMVDRILCLLASYGVVTCSLDNFPGGKAERLYGLSPACKFLMKNDDEASLAHLGYFHWDEAFVKSWYHLKDAVLEGGVPFSKAHSGKTALEHVFGDPKLNEVFHRAMRSHTCIAEKKILETYKGFEGLGTIVDVGGGTGGMLNLIITKYPTLKGINFDLPHVIAEAPSYPGVEHVGGDMLTNIPEGDAIFMKCVTHMWGDEALMKLLENCYKALPENGKVILAELILPQLPDSSDDTKLAFHMDCKMLIQIPGGKERTVEELEELAKGAGFRGFRLISKVYGIATMELLKEA